MNSQLLSRWEARARPLLVCLPPRIAFKLYSQGRKRFVERLAREVPKARAVPADLSRTLWGLHFRSPIFNAAGMFKNGHGYELAVAQGAGAFLAGTTTARPRTGNSRHGIRQPFAPYPRSGAASNWLGLPNDGDQVVAARLARVETVDGCPLGASVAADDQLPAEQRMDGVIRGLGLYERAGVDFLELNESCPNTRHATSSGDSAKPASDVIEQLTERLHRVREGFLERRQRPVPVIVKFATDTDRAQVPALVDLLIDLGFDGVNFGNTTTDHEQRRQAIAVAEQPLFDAFVSSFRGGLSGRPLKKDSLALCKAAVARVAERSPSREFHVVRTGGVESAGDLIASGAAGVALCQWFTGYFEAFSTDGHDLYSALYRSL